MLRLSAKFVILLALGVLPLGALADTPQTPDPPKTVHHRAAIKKRPKAKAKTQVAEEKSKPRPEPVEIPAMSPEQLPAQAPVVSYQSGRLTVDSENSTMKDILGAIRKQTNVQMDLPATMGTDRVAAHLTGVPGEVISALLEGTSWDYIIVGSPGDSDHLQKLIVTSAGGGVATSLSRGGNLGANKDSAIPGESGIDAAEEEQNDPGDQPPPDENADRNDQDQPRPPDDQPPPSQPPPQPQSAQGNGAPINNPNQPMNIDQFNQGMRHPLPQQPPNQPQPQQ
jgi:hypothetical protein